MRFGLGLGLGACNRLGMGMRKIRVLVSFVLDTGAKFSVVEHVRHDSINLVDWQWCVMNGMLSTVGHRLATPRRF